jgi:hypothetical protein
MVSRVREFVSLEQAMVRRFPEVWFPFLISEFVQVGLERVKEYSDLAQEPPEFIEPRPDPSWPEHGAIQCENLVIRYAVRHLLNIMNKFLNSEPARTPRRTPQPNI